MKYTPSTNSIKSMNVQTAQPLDIKDWFEDLTDLEDITIGNDPFSYYEGMLAKNVDTGQIYRWIENTEGLISGGYTYGTYEHDGVVYTGRTFNFVDVANRVVVFDYTETFPPIDLNYPQGTIALVEIFDDPDYELKIFKKTNNLLPGTWSEMIHLVDVSSSSAIEAVVIAMFAGTGSADTIARSDHNHDSTYSASSHDHDSDYMDINKDGLLLRGTLDSGDTIEYLPTIIGIWQIPDGSSVPTGFPSSAEIGYTYGVTDEFIMIEMPMGGIEIYREIIGKDGPACYNYYDNGWKGWTRFEATQVEILTGTSISKTISPFGLRNHESKVTLSLDSGWSGNAYIRELTNGMIHIWGEIIGGEASDFTFEVLDTKYRPDAIVKKPAIYFKSTDFLTGLITIETDGKISAEGYVSSGSERAGTFIFDFFYEIEV